MKTLCRKCQSPNVYEQDGELCCMMCGKRTPVSGVESIKITEMTGREDMGVKKQCRNCERTMSIQQDGLCGGCNQSVVGLKKDSFEYLSALADAKKRFTDPDYKRSAQGGGKSPKETVRAKRTIGTVVMKKGLEVVKSNKDIKSSAVDLLITERNALQDRVFKLNQAIELLRA